MPIRRRLSARAPRHPLSDAEPHPDLVDDRRTHEGRDTPHGVSVSATTKRTEEHDAEREARSVGGAAADLERHQWSHPAWTPRT